METSTEDFTAATHSVARPKASDRKCIFPVNALIANSFLSARPLLLQKNRLDHDVRQTSAQSLTQSQLQRRVRVPSERMLCQ